MATCAQDYKFYDDEAARRYEALSHGGMKSVFIYSQNVYTNGEAVKYDADDRSVRTVAIAGVIYAPVSLFADFIGASAAVSGTTVELGYNGVTHTCEAVVTGGMTCLPVIDTARALGLSSKAYYEGRLAVIGAESDIAALDSDEKLAEAGAYLTLGGYDPYAFTSDDYLAARKKWRVMLVGSPELNDVTNEVIADKINSITASAKAKLSTMNRGEDRVILWGNKPPVESDELGIQYSGLRLMARAWGTYGSELYHSEELLEAVLDGVEWMYQHMYGEAEIAGTGWRDAHAFNW